MTRQDCLNKILLLSDQQLEELINLYSNQPTPTKQETQTIEQQNTEQQPSQEVEETQKFAEGGVLNLEEELQKILPTDEYLKLTIKNYSEFNKL